MQQTGSNSLLTYGASRLYRAVAVGQTRLWGLYVTFEGKKWGFSSRRLSPGRVDTNVPTDERHSSVGTHSSSLLTCRGSPRLRARLLRLSMLAAVKDKAIAQELSGVGFCLFRFDGRGTMAEPKALVQNFLDEAQVGGESRFLDMQFILFDIFTSS